MFYYLFVCRTKKLFEFPVERDFPKENAFNAVQYPFLFQKFLRIRFFDAEVRFFGTAIEIKMKRLLIRIAGCERHLLFKKKVCAFLIHYVFLFSFLDNIFFSKNLNE